MQAAIEWKGRPARKAVLEVPAGIDILDKRISALAAALSRLFGIPRDQVLRRQAEALDVHVYTAEPAAKKSLPDMDAKLYAFRYCAGLVRMLTAAERGAQ